MFEFDQGAYEYRCLELMTCQNVCLAGNDSNDRLFGRTERRYKIQDPYSTIESLLHLFDKMREEFKEDSLTFAVIIEKR